MEELDTALARLIEQATTGIDASVGFLQAQLPDVVVQLLMWHGVKSAIIGFIGLTLLALVYPVVKRVYRLTNDDEFFATFAGLPMVVIGGAATAHNLIWLQIWIAPKVWLLEYAANLVN